MSALRDLAEVDRIYPIHEDEQYLVGFGGSPMPLIDFQVMEGVFSSEDKKLMIEKITQAFGEVAGKTLESGVSIRIHEIESGSWGTGGKAITTDDAKAWRAQG